ncbi:helix-turn-helix domain-containing protein [Alphaproteobacteria bacterium GH1-50]|uniref:Helix-turn-helix domain-containing protein n=1 Tax=Kangsaoukella pontilimi TaxID=2691042 RepID=A0A7C9MUE0_9RHOB|nr:helix-turn-helix transcriptional regulator [Kangsaoukella pontilimi]MXQ06820.1 helix-turn-helix domain-containing protein [Kangsaoukella pontilimi]
MTDIQTHQTFLTVRELAALLRVSERKVYDLAASGQVPVSKATGKLLFPETEVRAWLDAARSGPAGGAAPMAERPAVFLGSHDPLLEWAIRHSGSGLATIFDASLDGLRRFQAGEGVAAGLHIHEDDGGWNRTTVAGAVGNANAALVHWTRRERGFVARPEHAGALADIGAVARLRLAPRQSEAGAEVLMREVFSKAGVPNKSLRTIPAVRSEQEAVLAVLQGEADVAFGLRALAEPFGLAFHPVVEESFDILVDRKSWFEPGLQALFDFAQSAVFRDHLSKMAGLDASDLGRVVWNA